MARTYRAGVLADCAFDGANLGKAVCVSESSKALKIKRFLPILDAGQPANRATPPSANASPTRPGLLALGAQVPYLDKGNINVSNLSVTNFAVSMSEWLTSWDDNVSWTYSEPNWTTSGMPTMTGPVAVYWSEAGAG
jgi:hypothetical protein